MVLVIEIALGIVLGLLIWNNLDIILASAGVLAIVGIIVVVIGTVIFLVNSRSAPALPTNWDREYVTLFVRAFIAIAAMLGVPYWSFNKIAAMKSKLGSIFRGDPPFDRSSYKAYLRVLILTPFFLATAIVGGAVGALVGYGMTTRF